MKLSIIYSQYNSQKMLDYTLDVYRTYLCLNDIEFLMVDDGSDPPLTVNGKGFNLQHLRIHKDIPWNQGGAKNLGTMHANADWLLYLDADRIAPIETLDWLMTNAESGKFYIFAQKDHDGTLRGTKKPFGVFAAEKKEMMRVKGFDERFCGEYGYEDLQLSKKLKVHQIQKTKLNDIYLVAYDKHESLDGKVKYLSRDLARNKELLIKSRRERYSSENSLWLNFEWSLIQTWKC